MKIVDTYVPVTDAAAKAIKEKGYAGVARYLGKKSCSFDKGISPEEVKILKENGLKIVSIFERDEKSMLRGYQQGKEDASDALSDALWLTQPFGSAIYFACDFDAVQSQFGAVENYMQGVREVLDGKYLDGLYGSYAVLKNVKAARYYASVSWQYGQTIFANIKQGAKVTIDGTECDENDVVTSPGFWGEDVQPTNVVTSPDKYDVVVDGRVFPAIAVENKTYILWTVLGHLGIPYSHLGFGQMQYLSQTIKGEVYGDDTYLPWDTLGVSAKKVEWEFISAKS